ncbi:hypothetical protein GN958_ATG17437 [Phytophthora infestans]|uniref:Uncharacterized protein n=1 Tax=Phytophthora infestans TaxID=4787 RepID=A0A8S9U3C8_PHYIN|nr:hypothetical protein GN958_ATG17437 [Phytophthora infestans]
MQASLTPICTVTRKCLPALKNRNYIGRTSSEKVGNCESSVGSDNWIIRQVNGIYYLVGYTLGALNFQDPVTGGGKYDLKDNTKAREHTRKATYGQIHDLGPGSISSNIRLGYGTIHGRKVKIFHCCSTPSPRLAKTLKLHHLNSSEVTERADPALPTGTQGEESSAEHGSSGDPLR